LCNSSHQILNKFTNFLTKFFKFKYAFIFKIEPVKKLKRLWESQVALLESQKSLHKANLMSQTNSNKNNVVLCKEEEKKSPKKWSSMQLINESAQRDSVSKERRLSKGAYDTDKGEFVKPSTVPTTNDTIQKSKPSVATISNTSIGSSIRTIEDVRSNMSFVLDEIRKRDHFKNKQNEVKSAPIENKQRTEANKENQVIETATNESNESDDERIVQRLKQKFDKKDQRIIKVISNSDPRSCQQLSLIILFFFIPLFFH